MTTLAESRPSREFSTWSRLRGWLRNPWGRPRFLVLITWAYIFWSIVPVLIAVQFSFNATRSRTVWDSFSWRWYFDTARRCKLYDFARRCWTDYADRPTSAPQPA